MRSGRLMNQLSTRTNPNHIATGLRIRLWPSTSKGRAKLTSENLHRAAMWSIGCA